MNLLGIIPARSGSKGIPGKNIKFLGGRPLLAYSVMAARKAGIFSRLILSTDSEAIARQGKALGVEVPFMRPSELARDDTPMLPVLRHAVKTLGETGWMADVICILQPTAPFRSPAELISAFGIIRTEAEVDSVVSVEPVPDHYSPYFLLKIDGQRLKPFMPDGLKYTRRQDAPKAYSRNGDFYFTRTKTLLDGNSIYGQNCRPVIVTHEERVNLDTMDDWVLAEKLLPRFLAANGLDSGPA
jgi:CMP-N-acetylneuraminic acid synthetase